MSRQGLTLDTGLVVGITLLITAAPLLPAKLAVAACVGIGLLTVIAWLKRAPGAAPVGIFCVACLGLALAGARYSQLFLGFGLVVYALVVRRVAWLRGTLAWVRWGAFGLDVCFMATGCVLVAAVALWAWYSLLHPDLADLVQTFVPAAPLGLLVAGGLAFSMINAAVEEGAYRGVIQYGLDSTLGPGRAALVLQAAAFGALHIHGFPRGWVGVGLATTYGLLMGGLRRQAGGMLAPWVAHVFTDVVIAGIVLLLARPAMAVLAP